MHFSIELDIAFRANHGSFVSNLSMASMELYVCLFIAIISVTSMVYLRDVVVAESYFVLHHDVFQRFVDRPAQLSSPVVITGFVPVFCLPHRPRPAMVLFGRSPRPFVACSSSVRVYRPYRCIDTLTDCTASLSTYHAIIMLEDRFCIRVTLLQTSVSCHTT